MADFLCSTCGSIAKPKGRSKGSGPAEAILWVGSTLLFFFTMFVAMSAMGLRDTGGPNPHAMGGADAEFIGTLSMLTVAGFVISVIYSIARRVNRPHVCRLCQSPNIMPLNTPVAQQKVRDIEDEKMRAKYGEEVAAYRKQIRAEIGRAPAQ